MIDQWLQNPDRIGAFVILVTAVISFMRGLIVPKWTHDAVIAAAEKARLEIVKDRDEYRAMILRALDVSDRSLKVAEKKGHEVL